MGRRFLRYLLIGLFLALLGGLWAFSFFLFNPFEGDYDYPVASLIPRDVDFYLAKNELRRDFDPFPRLAFQDEFEASPAGQAILELGLRERLASWRIAESLSALETALARLPVPIDPLALFGGRSLVVAGNFAGPDLANTHWVVYGRTGWLGKLGLELVAEGWIDLAAQGLTLVPFVHEEKTLGVELRGSQLPRPLFLARIQDVVILSTQGEFLVAAARLESTRGQDSLDRSAKYTDNLVRTGRVGDELELYLDQRALAENLSLAGTWPNPRANDVAQALSAKFFQLGALRELIGTLDFAKVLSLDLVGELSSNVLSPFQQRLYDTRGFDKPQMLEAARLAPADAGLFVYLHADIGDLLRELRSVFLVLDPAAVSNLEDFVRTAFNHPDLDHLIDDIDGALRDRVALMVREYDYPEELGEKVPPHDSTPVFAWALVLWQQDEGKLEAIRKVIDREDVLAMMKVQGATPGSLGLWDNTLQGGARVKEYWNVLVPGTGQIATLEMKGREPYLVITNENRLLGQIFKLYTTGLTDEGLTRLAEATAFQTWLNGGLGSANLLAWFAPRALTRTARRIALQQASQNGADFIDWNVERPRIEREIIAKHFPGERWGRVSEANRNSYETLVQEAVDRFQASYLEQNLPAQHEESERWLRAWGGLTGSFLEIATGRKRLRLHGRLGLGFEAAEARL